MDDMSTPQAPPTQPPAQPPVMPPVSPPYAPPSAPLPPVKPKTDVGFLLLGLFSPFVVSGILGTVMGVVSSAMAYSEESSIALGVLGIILNAMIPLLFVGFLVAWLIGRQKGNVKLASFGKGGLWAFAVGALLALLLFGTCVLALGGSGF